MRLAHFATSVGATLFLALSAHAQNEEGDDCRVDLDCLSGCCGSQLVPPVCLDTLTQGPGDECFTDDGCDCAVGLCDNGFCPEGTPSPVTSGKDCIEDTECLSGCCASSYSPSICVPKGTQLPGEECFTEDGCDCLLTSQCIEGVCPGCDDEEDCLPDFPFCCPSLGYCVESREDCGVTSAPVRSTPAPTACANGTSICDDPHMQGLRGQHIDWSGVDGGWYCLVADDNANIHVNVLLTAPLPENFPNRQLITGLAIVSEGHSLVIEVSNPYDVRTNGCPSGVSPCLANGGLRAIVDGKEKDRLLGFSRNEYTDDGIAVSASNLPVECRQFGGERIWGRMYDEMLQGRRHLAIEQSFEDWILSFDHMAAPDWCTQYIEQHDLAEVQSIHFVFKIVTSSVTVRLNVGTNYQGNGELDWDGRVLPDLEFWQMDVGLHGLSIESESLSGILGETARPVLDKDGRPVMEGYEAFRGTVEDYRVSGSLGTKFALQTNP